jgi:hypothetical protein
VCISLLSNFTKFVVQICIDKFALQPYIILICTHKFVTYICYYGFVCTSLLSNFSFIDFVLKIFVYKSVS